jgi:hypothetical protein
MRTPALICSTRWQIRIDERDNWLQPQLGIPTNDRQQILLFAII